MDKRAILTVLIWCNYFLKLKIQSIFGSHSKKRHLYPAFLTSGSLWTGKQSWGRSTMQACWVTVRLTGNKAGADNTRWHYWAGGAASIPSCVRLFLSLEELCLRYSGLTTSAFHLVPFVQIGTTPGAFPELAVLFPILVCNSCWVDSCPRFSRQPCPVLLGRFNRRFPSLPSRAMPLLFFPPLDCQPSLSKIIWKKWLGCIHTMGYIHQ